MTEPTSSASTNKWGVSAVGEVPLPPTRMDPYQVANDFALENVDVWLELRSDVVYCVLAVRALFSHDPGENSLC